MEAIEEKVDNTLLGKIREKFDNIPAHWGLTTLGDAFKWRSGGTPLRTNPKYYGGDIPWLIIGDLNDGLVTDAATKITQEGLDNSASRWVDEGSVMLAMYGSIGKLGIAGSRLTTNQAIAFTNPAPHEAKYLFYFLMYTRGDLATLGKGATQKNISQAVIKVYPFPLAPLSDQKRIVAAIETQLGRLDAAVARLHAAKAKLKRYKQAVLKAAFSEGEPTRLEELCEFITKGTTPTKDMLSANGTVPFIKVYNLTRNGSLDFTVDPTFVDQSVHEKFLARSIVYPDDLLMNIVGPPLGKVSLVPDDYPEWNINQAIVRYRTKERLRTKYLMYYLLCDSTAQELMATTKATAGQFNLTLAHCRDLEVPLIPVEKQDLIIGELEDRLGVIDETETTLDAQLIHSTRLRQAVLKRAFEGRLV